VGFSLYLVWDSFKKIFFVVLVTFGSILFAEKYRIFLYFITLVLVLVSFPLAFKVFDGSFLWTWEQGVVVFFWFIFFGFAIAVPFFRPGKKYLWPATRGYLRSAVVLAALVIGFFLFSIYLFFARPPKSIGGVLHVSGDNFQFNPFISLEPRVSLSFERLLIAQMKERRHIRHFTLAKYKAEGNFQREEVSWEENEPPMYRKKIAEQWHRSGYAKDKKPPLYFAKYEQKYFLKRLAPTVVLGVNRLNLILPLKNQTPERFSGIFKADSYDLQSVPSAISAKRAGFQGARKSTANPDKQIPENQRDFQKYYTTYDKSEFTQKVKIFTEEIVRGKSSQWEKVLAMQDYLQKNYHYSLNPGGENITNRLEYFLFEGKKGYCTYFAFAFALMARVLEIPARVAVGFLPDPRLRKFDFWWITGAQAHAWVEIYFKNFGWQTFDVPTANPFAGIPGARALDIRDELKNDLAAIEKNQDSKLLQELERRKLAEKREKNLEQAIRLGKIFLLILVLLWLWFFFQNYRFRLFAFLFPRRKEYYFFQDIIWTLARFNVTRPMGTGWTRWSKGVFAQELDRVLGQLEIIWEEMGQGKAKGKDIPALRKESGRLLIELKMELRKFFEAFSPARKVRAFISPLVWFRFRQ
jgi:transglutaminase-like putative cysteine protease